MPWLSQISSLSDHDCADFSYKSNHHYIFCCICFHVCRSFLRISTLNLSTPHSVTPVFPLLLQTTERCASGRTLPTRRTRRWWRRGRASPTCCPPPEVSPPPAFTVKINALFYYVPSSHPPFVLTAKIIPAVPRRLHPLFTPSQSCFHTHHLNS